MSKYMLCDDATINDINPFVVHDFSLPGGVRQTPEFGDYKKDLNKTGDIEIPTLSPICQVAKTSGDRTVDFCTGGREPPCPLNRPVHARRNIDYGWTRQTKPKSNSKVQNVETRGNGNGGVIGFLIFIIIVALVVSFVRR